MTIKTFIFDDFDYVDGFITLTSDTILFRGGTVT